MHVESDKVQTVRRLKIEITLPGQFQFVIVVEQLLPSAQGQEQSVMSWDQCIVVEKETPYAFSASAVVNNHRKVVLN